MASIFQSLLNQVVSAVSGKRKKDEEDKKKQEASKRIFNQSDFQKPKAAASSAQMKPADDKKTPVSSTFQRAATLAGEFVKSPGQTLLRESGKLAQQFPDTTIKTVTDKEPVYDKKKKMGLTSFPKEEGKFHAEIGPLKVPVTELGAKAIPFISSIPGSAIKSYGKTAERLSTDKGRSDILAGVKNIPGEVIDTVKDPQKALKLLQNPAVEDALNLSDVLTLGAGSVMKTGFKKTIKEAAEKGVKTGIEKQLEEKAVKSTAEKLAADQLAQTSGKSAEASLDASSTLRPLSTTSIGETLAPDVSKVAETSLPSDVTKTLLPSNKYTPSTPLKSVLEDPGFIQKYNSTIQEKPFLDKLLKDTAGDRKTISGVKDFSTAGGKIQRKLATDPTYSEDQLGDLIRGNIIAKDANDAHTLIATLQKNSDVISVDNYIDTPNAWGYQGVNINIKTPKGNIAEVQIHTPETAKIQEALHPLYEKWRSADSVPVSVFEEARTIVNKVKGVKVAVELPLTTPKLPVQTEANTAAASAQLSDPGVQLPPDLPLIAPKVAPSGMKIRKFVQTVADSPTSHEPLAQGVQGSYAPQTNKGQLAAAQARIDANLDDAMSFAKQKDVPAALEGEKVATQQKLMMKFQNEGNYNSAIDMAQTAAEQATSKGQAIQALSIWGRLTPEGALRFAQQTINKANEGRAVKDHLKIDEATAKKITDIAAEVQKLPEGSKEKTRKTAKLLDAIAAQVPSTLGQKISALQTMAQLINPKTAIRNTLGNLMFATLENAKDLVATPLDMGMSLITGKRTKSFPNLITQAKGAKEGFMLGLEDALTGTNTANANSRFDLPKTKVFTDPVFGNLEKLLNVELQATDRAMYTAGYNNTLEGEMKRAKVTEATPEMHQIAHLDGLYKTFQDDNAISTALGGMKKSLNAGGDFGLGDLVIKYPHIPGSLLSKSLDYSQVGFVKAVFELLRPIIPRLKNRQFSQKAVVEATSRALVGTAGLIGSGAVLHRLGVITGKEDLDPDIAAVKKTQGQGNYKLNASALFRLAMSGFNPDAAKPQKKDWLVSYDWFQPMAVNLSMGASLDANKGNFDDNIFNEYAGTLADAADTITEQPVTQGIKRFFSARKITDGVIDALVGMPASFIPTALNQIKQMTDNTSRNSDDPNKTTQAINEVMARLPLASKKLPARVDVFGKNIESYQDGSNNAFNVFVNPAFISRLKEDPIGKEVLDLYINTGESKQAPRVVAKSIQMSGGVSKKLTAEEQGKMQRFVGKLTVEKFKEIMNDSDYKNMSDEEKIDRLSDELTTIHTAAKYALLKNQTKRKPSRAVLDLLEEKGFDNLPLMAPKN